jgi:hypothetical protein
MMNKQETKKLKELGFDSPGSIVICPVNNEPIVLTESMQISIIENEAVWWQCPECGGWHIIVLGKKKVNYSSRKPLARSGMTA